MGNATGTWLHDCSLFRTQGGYNVESISKSALECVKVLLGELPPEMPALVAQPAAVRTLHLVSEEQSRYWDCIQPTFATQNGK